MEGLLKSDIYSIGFKLYDQNASSEASLLYDGHKAMGLANLSDTAQVHYLSRTDGCWSAVDYSGYVNA